MTTNSLIHEERIDLHINSDLKILLSRAAAYSGMSLSSFLVSAAGERARQIIAENEILSLSAQDWEAFLAGLDAPDEPLPRLEAATERYRRRRAETDAG